MPARQRPVWIPPMLATLGPLPAGQGNRWAFEVKTLLCLSRPEGPRALAPGPVELKASRKGIAERHAWSLRCYAACAQVRAVSSPATRSSSSESRSAMAEPLRPVSSG